MTTIESNTGDPTTIESEVRSYCRTFPTTFVSARGSELIDHTGRRYLDFLAGCSALNYGHNDPDMAEALMAYLTASGITHGLDLRTGAKERFLDRFDHLVLRPRGLGYRVQFTGPTGTNAVEAAIKLARKVTGRSSVVAFTNGFHGVTLGALAATGNSHNRAGAGALPLAGVTRAFYDGYLGPDVDTAAVLEAVLHDPSSGFDPPAAFLVEVVQGEGGLNPASAGWLRRIAALARRVGALLIVDDIQAGCGRTGPFFSFEGTGVVPDMITLSKSIAGFGLPMALVLMRPELDQWSPGEHNGTFRGNNLAFVTAAVALEKFWSDSRLTADVDRRARLVRSVLEPLAALGPGWRVKGRGLMVGIDVGTTEMAAAVTAGCFQRGLIIETAGPRNEVVKVLAPLTTPDAQLAEGMAIVADVVAALAAGPLAGVAA
ncbi:MAG: diaminobutyrate--2-oxoglutarate transaminase [Acidimicrobiales bacterium]